MKSIVGVVTLVVAVVLAAGHPAAQKATLPDVLKAAASYLLQYSDRLQAVSADEDYLQMEVSGGAIRLTRKLLSDVALVGIGNGRVVIYRDVYSRDANLVHEHDGRLLKLFQSNNPEALIQAQTLQANGVRQYVSPNMQLFDDVVAPL